MGTPLWWAAHYGSAEVCRSLLQSGARLDVGGGDLRSPNTMMMNDNDYEPMRKYIANYLWSFLFLRKETNSENFHPEITTNNDKKFVCRTYFWWPLITTVIILM